MIERGSEEYRRCLKIVDYFNQKFEKEGFVGRAFYVDGAGFFYMAYSNSDLWGMEIDLVQDYGDYSYEYDATYRLVILTESVDNMDIDIDLDLATDSETFIEKMFSWYCDVKWMKIFREEGEAAAKAFSDAINREKEIELIKSEISI